MPYYYLRTYGCQMNEYDSETIAGALEKENYIRTGKLKEADLVILNTCCVRGTAESKVFGLLGSLKNLKQKKPSLIIGVIGCMAQKEGKSLQAKYPHVDLLVGPQSLDKFIFLLKKATAERKRQLDISERERIFSLPPLRESKVSALVPISIGCDNFCAYCIVPYVRGRMTSRPVSNILEEVEELSRQNYQEIILVGQNVNSYGKDSKGEIDFPMLLEKIHAKNFKRIRFITSHPKDLSDSLIDKMANLPQICRHLHLPVQAGDNEVLQNMNRGYTIEHYRRLVKKLRQNIPQIAFSTDLIVGFPTETEEQFTNTVHFLQEINYDQVFSFMYSPREGTKAAQLPDLPLEIKRDRLERANKIIRHMMEENNRRLIGKKMEIIVEGPSKKDHERLFGRTDTNKIVILEEGIKGRCGELVPVEIISAYTWGLSGKLI